MENPVIPVPISRSIWLLLYKIYRSTTPRETASSDGHIRVESQIIYNKDKQLIEFNYKNNNIRVPSYYKNDNKTVQSDHSNNKTDVLDTIIIDKN
jgi:hypothetical protein